MVETQIRARGIGKRVCVALQQVPRHRFMPESTWSQAYDDHPVPIGLKQTISQPFIVALMTELAQIEPGERVLEVGTGSGYQSAVLAEMGAEVYSIEIIASLATRAREALDATGYSRVTTRLGDGYKGWPEHAPFDAILVTASPDHIPPSFMEQLKIGGRLVIPVGTRHRQDLLVYERTASGLQKRSTTPVLFVPMTGEAQAPKPSRP